MILIPLPETWKSKIDLAVVPGAISMPYLGAFDWAQSAAFAATIYGVVRLLEWAVLAAVKLWAWFRNRSSAAKPVQPADE